MTDRVTYFAYKCHFLHDNQFSFLSGRSCDAALIKARNWLDAHYRRTYVVSFLSLDIQGAFPSARWDLILKAAKQLRMPDDLFALLSNFFRNRKVTATVGDVTKANMLSRGCPQGSVCGPITWNLLFNSFFTTVENAFLCRMPHLVQVFTDDGPKPSDVNSTLQTICDILTKWADETGVQFTPLNTGHDDDTR